MTAITQLATAKLHLRVDGTDDEALITLWIGAAEKYVSEYIARYVYVDQAALTAAIATVPAALAAATVAYDAAILAIEVMAEGVDRDMAVLAAEHNYTQAKIAARMTHQGMVVNDQIRAAYLLIIGDLHETREAQVVKELYKNRAVEYLLQPYQIMGV